MDAVVVKAFTKVFVEKSRIFLDLKYFFRFKKFFFFEKFIINKLEM